MGHGEDLIRLDDLEIERAHPDDREERDEQDTDDLYSLIHK
jgi:hypothetical protein